MLSVAPLATRSPSHSDAAGFLVRFADAKTPRAVTIRPRNTASYTRDSDASVVDEWLINRGFVKAA